MIRPLVVFVIAVMAFASGYIIGMFHTMYYTLKFDKQELKEAKEKYVTLTHKVGD